MADKKDVKALLDLLEQNKPEHSFDEIRNSNAGIFAVLKYLNDNKGEIKSKDISDYMKISSARMAVILKAMEKRGLIVKAASNSDGRAVIICLSEEGKRFSGVIRNQMFRMAEQLVDEFGLEHINSMLNDINRIKEIAQENMKGIMGADNV